MGQLGIGVPSTSALKRGYLKHGFILAAGVMLAGVASAAAFAPQAGSPRNVQLAVQPGTGLPSFPDIVDSVRASVIGVRTNLTSHPGTSPSRSDLRPSRLVADPLLPFGGEGEQERRGNGQVEIIAAQGSGFFISADGYAVTNGHVVGNNDTVEVDTDDGKTLSAKVVGIDPVSDLALIKVEGEGFSPVKISQHPPRVGEWVLAIGNPFGLGGTVTAGIVSARDRNIGTDPYDDLIQIDAPVNQGNSGGPAFDLDGKVVGVNAMTVSPSGGSIGIAFAIPAETLASVVPQLKEQGFVSRGWIGVQIQSSPRDGDSAQPRGATIAGVQPDGPAGKAGLTRGDVLTSVDGNAIEDARDLTRRIAGSRPGGEVKLGILRNGKEAVVTVTLGELPVKRPQRVSRPEPKSTIGSGGGLGLELAPDAGGKGVVIARIDPHGSAATRGLAPGDMIVEAGGQAVSAPDEVMAALDKARSEGRRFVLLQLKSGETTRFVAVPSDPT
jgi:serine protease Do